ncbi:hypothetical protein Pint_00095 [Pistacia integerrima]|uniref:Uncharacterized protein n=1 Tax=Pistacia integerrima TaxID=434235 RepID=A0ACC0ZFL1_9ROSI|nr:hypothetical protein Pint_00095 [Pistacia integerrima]
MATVFDRAVAWDMLKVYSNFIDAQERRRIERLELFDEFEEWHMMQASKSLIPSFLNVLLGTWEAVDYGVVVAFPCKLSQEHYCVTYAINDAMGLFGNFGFPNDEVLVLNSPSAAST